MPDQTGRRRKQSGPPLGRIAVLVFALVTVGFLVNLPEPDHTTAPAGPLATGSTWTGPESVPTIGTLADGSAYTPRIFLAADTSIGLATASGGVSLRLVLVAGTTVTELRRLLVADEPQFSGFAAAGDNVVWAEAIAPDGGAVRTSVWRTNWKTAARPWSLTITPGEPTFSGGQYDVVVHNGTVFWTSVGSGNVTEVRSVSLGGGSVKTRKVTGDFVLSAWPWAVSTDGGRGRPVQLVNYDTNGRLSLATTAQETATCSPIWCRIGVFGPDSLTQLDIVKSDGSGRRRIAGSEATPTIVDVALLDRYVPLTTDRGQNSDLPGVGLSLYDITTGQTDLIATDVDNVRGSGSMVWWSTMAADALTWHAIDLRSLR